MILPKFPAKIVDGKIKVLDPAHFRHYLGKFQPTDNLDLMIGKHRNQRSNKQNRYYWGCVLPLIAEHTGHGVDELHEVFKRLFLKKKFVVWDGKEIAMPGSTPEQDTLEFTEYIEKICVEAATKLGITIPPPGSYGVEKAV